MKEWAAHRGDASKRSRKGHGCVVAFTLDGHQGRMEWGPPQRAYIPTRELRVRIDMGLPPQLEMMVMSRPLARRLESDAFAQMVRGQQTGIDSVLSEEQRWLSVFEPVDFDANPVVQKSFLILGSSPPHARRWVAGDLANRLVRASSRWLGAETPLVLMTLRGRIYLRTEVPVLDSAVLDGARGLAEVAATRAVLCQKRPRTGKDAAGSLPVLSAAAATALEQTSTSTFAQDAGLEDDERMAADLMDDLSMSDDFDPAEYSLGVPDTDLQL
jgi:hypothetical protein